MKPKIILLLCLAMPLLCMAQKQLVLEYSYDASGNRVLRRTIHLIPNEPPTQAPPAPPASDLPISDLLSSDLPISDLKISDLTISDVLISDFLAPEYFVENIARVEIKIYPNPATEKITLAISGWEHLQTGMFKLYSLNGQLLQEQSVHSATTTVSLAGFPKGAYILKVHINGITEDWKIIKQ